MKGLKRLNLIVLASLVSSCSTTLRTDCSFTFDYQDKGIESLNDYNLKTMRDYKVYCE